MKVKINDCEIYYEEKGQGLPLIMIHGGFLDCRMWDEQFEYFASKFRVVRYDVRNHGKSKSVDVEYKHYVDLKALMDHLKIEKTILMGLSMGGSIASDFAVNYPERMLSLILVGPGLTGYEIISQEVLEYLRNYREAVEAEDLERLTEVFLQGWTDGPYRKPEEVNSKVRRKSKMMIEGTLNIYNKNSIEKSVEPPTIKRLEEIKVPTFIVFGNLDMPDIKSICKIYRSNIPKSEMITIDGAAHLVSLEKPAEFNKNLEKFLSRILR